MLIEQIITRTIYESLRQVLVVDGWLPDINDFDIDNPDPTTAKTAWDNFQSAILGIGSEKGFSIELFSYTENQTKGFKKPARIVIHNLSFLPGALGNDPSAFYVKEGSYFIRKQSTTNLSDFTFMIYAIGNTSEQMMIMNDIIMRTLPIKGYIKRYTDTELKPFNNFFVNLKDKAETEGLSEGVMERYFKYEIPDLNEIPEFVLEGPISPINDINLETEIP